MANNGRDDDLETMIREWAQRMIPPTLRGSESPGTVPAVDERMLESVRALDPEGAHGLLAAGVTRFLDGVPERLAAIGAAVSDNQLDAVARLAHRLESPCGGYGAFRMAAIAAEMETRAQGGNAHDLRFLLQVLEQEFVPVKAALSLFVAGGGASNDAARG
jgi:HPt (histidine-containing phosphotransfer) domain-containing protein